MSCYDKYYDNKNQIQFESWSGDVSALTAYTKDCLIDCANKDTYHWISIKNFRGSTGYKVDVSGYPGNPNNIKFQHLTNGTSMEQWDTPQSVLIPAKTYKRPLPYTNAEAKIVNLNPAHGKDNIFVDFTYTEQKNPSNPPPSKTLAFNVSY